MGHNSQLLICNWNNNAKQTKKVHLRIILFGVSLYFFPNLLVMVIGLFTFSMKAIAHAQRTKAQRCFSTKLYFCYKKIYLGSVALMVYYKPGRSRWEFSWLNENITQQWLRTSLCWQAHCVWTSWAKRSESKTQWASQHREVWSHCCVMFEFYHENLKRIFPGLGYGFL